MIISVPPSSSHPNNRCRGQLTKLFHEIDKILTFSYIDSGRTFVDTLLVISIQSVNESMPSQLYYCCQVKVVAW